MHVIVTGCLSFSIWEPLSVLPFFFPLLSTWAPLSLIIYRLFTVFIPQCKELPCNGRCNYKKCHKRMIKAWNK